MQGQKDLRKVQQFSVRTNSNLNTMKVDYRSSQEKMLIECHGKTLQSYPICSNKNMIYVKILRNMHLSTTN